MVQTAVVVIVATMTARIYAQLAGRDQKRHLRGAVRGRMPSSARVGETLDRALVRRETGADVGRQRGRMIERAGVDVDAADAVAPGPAHRFGKQPAAVALAGQFRDEPDEGELALAGLAIIELEHADVRPALVNDGKQVDRRDRG